MSSKAYVLLALFALLILSSVTFFYYKPISGVPTATKNENMSESEINSLYGPFKTIYFGHVQIRASVADNAQEREQGLSGTPALPIGIVKLFMFEEPILTKFWMKDMNYPIDIMWLNRDKKIIYIVANLNPDTYPTTFGPNEPSLYVIETPAGMTAREGIVVGSSFVW